MEPLHSARLFYADLIAAFAEASDPRIARAFAKIPREAFLGAGPWLVKVPDGYLRTPTADPALLYQDIVVALSADKDLNNGEPSLHARCLAAVAPQAGERVLQVGTGAGYYTALLAELVGPRGRVVGREIEGELAEAAARNLRPWPNVRIEARSGTQTPLPQSDVIYVCAGAMAPLSVWLQALSDGGRLIFPLTPTWGWGGMLLIERRVSGHAARFISQAMFFPCVGAQDPATEAALTAAFARGGSEGVRSLRLAPELPDETCWVAGRGWWLSTAEPAEPQLQ